MEYLLNASGYTQPCIREYEISASSDLKKGTVMCISDGAAAKATASGKILGVLDEDYNVSKDILNPRSGSGLAKINITPDGIFSFPVQTFTIATAGTATTLTLESSSAIPTSSAVLKGGYIKLISKGANSTNTDSVGCIRKITAQASYVLTVDNGGSACAGDVYAVFPPANFAYITLTSDALAFKFAASAGTAAKVVSSDTDKNTVDIIFSNHLYK